MSNDHSISCVCGECVEDAKMICQCAYPKYKDYICKICGGEKYVE